MPSHTPHCLKGYLTMKQALTDLQVRDLRHVWHPCSQMKDYEAFPPIVIKRGKVCGFMTNMISVIWMLSHLGGLIYLDMPIRVLARL